jgi:hypothetical protein
MDELARRADTAGARISSYVTGPRRVTGAPPDFRDNLPWRNEFPSRPNCLAESSERCEGRGTGPALRRIYTNGLEV